jgi:two-component system C4-dicarboxylate transport response regulator DctD
MSGTVLVVEDDALVREALGQTLELEGFSPVLAGSFIVAKDHISPEFEGVILSDIRMPGRDGLFLLDYVQSIDPELPVILLTGEGDIPMAVGAITAGAFDFLEKPCANDVLTSAVRKASRARELVLDNRHLKSQITRGDAASQMIFGVSAKVEALRNQVRRVAPLDDAVLIEGGPGSGIAKVAEVIHMLSPHFKGTFARIHGAGLTPDQLRASLVSASEGSVFVEEVGVMPQMAQFALLEQLEAGTGARVMAGTTAGQKRPDGASEIVPDLYYRLEALRVQIPELKERAEDIPVIFRHYVREVAEQSNVAEPRIPPELLADLMAMDWPGNTRALMNAATRFVLGLDAPLQGEPIGLPDKMAQVERSFIVEALQQNGGNASATAQSLRLPRKTFYDKLAKHGIRAEDYR